MRTQAEQTHKHASKNAATRKRKKNETETRQTVTFNERSSRES